MGHCVERDEDQGHQGFSIKTIVGCELSYTRGRRRKNMRAAERQGSRKGSKGDKAYGRKQRGDLGGHSEALAAFILRVMATIERS